MFEFFDERTYATIGEHGLENVDMSDFPHHTTSLTKRDPDDNDGAWSLKLFQKVNF